MVVVAHQTKHQPVSKLWKIHEAGPEVVSLEMF